MIETTFPLPPEVWQATPPEAHALISALHERVRDLEARLGQDSSNSSPPPSADPPQAPANVKRPAPPSGRKWGGQPGHPGHFRTRRPPEQVDHVMVVAPEVCRYRGQLFALWHRFRAGEFDRKALGTVTRGEGVEPTNNVSERALRPAVFWRTGSFGSYSPARSRFTERMLTVRATRRQQGRRLFDFLVTAGAAALEAPAAPSLLSAPLRG